MVSNPSCPIELTGNDLTFAQLYDVAIRGEKVSLAGDAVERMKASRAVVERVVASGETAYGINTGFGKLASVRISAEQVRQLQVNLVRSHACGVGADRGNLVRHVERQGASSDSIARLGRGVG